MPEAFVLVSVDVGKEMYVANTMKDVEGVKEVSLVYGVYDLVIRVEAPTMQQIRRIVAHNIRRNPHVRSTVTMIVAD